MRRKAGDIDAARESLAALRVLDPDDPLAVQLDAGPDGEPVPAVSGEARLANIAKLAATPLLRNPYQLAVGAIFETIRDLEVARVLDVGVGSGAQLAELLGLLREHEHRLRRLELVGLDFVDEFLQRAAQRVADAPAPLNTEVVFVPVMGRIEALQDPQLGQIAGSSGLDAANATIALHEVPGERKLAALRNLRRIAPGHLLIAEWNYCLENTLPETSLEFILNARHAASDSVAALTERHTHQEARHVVRDWLSRAAASSSARRPAPGVLPQRRLLANATQTRRLPASTLRAVLAVPRRVTATAPGSKMARHGSPRAATTAGRRSPSYTLCRTDVFAPTPRQSTPPARGSTTRAKHVCGRRRRDTHATRRAGLRQP
jgi:SAM-dependent methyltransferase